MAWHLKIGLISWLWLGLVPTCWAKVELSELYPRPSQGDEWVELHNTSDTSVTLQGWQLWDELSQPSLIYSFTTETILPQGWLVVPINRKLNDTGDGVTIKDATGLVIDFVHYDSAPADLSWARLGESWVFTASSPGSANPIPTPTPSPTPSPTVTPKPTITPTSIPAVVPTEVPSVSPTSPITMIPSGNLTSIVPTIPPAVNKIIQTTLARSSSPKPTPSLPSAPIIPTNHVSTSQIISIPQSPSKIVPWINAIMASLLLSSVVVYSYFLSHYFTHYDSSISITSDSLAQTSSPS